MPPAKPSLNYQQDAFISGEAHSFDARAFDDGIRSQGVTLWHWRAIPCPKGMLTKDDYLRRTHEDHRDCSNGFFYKKVGMFTGLFVGNSANEQHQEQGLLDGSTAQLTCPRFYDRVCDDYFLDPCDQEGQQGQVRIYLGPGDRLYLDEDVGHILWENSEYVEHSLSGVDRLRYPAVRIHHLVDNQLQEYRRGTDFNIDDLGRIAWLPGRSPGVDPETVDARGRVYSCWYLYRPYWYVGRISHQGRLVQTQDMATGERRVERMPMEVEIRREVQFQNSVSSGGETDDQRENPPPRDSSFVP